MSPRRLKERTFSCKDCFASITVIGPDHEVGAALRRVDWSWSADRIVVCRDCQK